MELRHLRNFLALAEELHFGRAARRVNMSQPALSKQVRQLEEELRVRLFNRTKRKVELTAAGHLFAGQIPLFLQQLEQSVALTVQEGRYEHNQITLGYTPGTVHIFSGILREFIKRFPNSRPVLKNVETARQIESLHNGSIDVGLITLTGPPELEGLAVESILQDRLMVAMPASHPLSSQRVIPLRALANETMCIAPLRNNQTNYSLINETCRRAGFSLHRFHEVDNLYHQLDLIRAGMGVSLLRASVQKIAGKGIVFQELQLPPVLGTALAYRRSNRTDLLLSFIKTAKEVAGRFACRVGH